MGYPISVYSDDDGAFKSKVKQLFDSEGINHIVTLTHANVVERFIRTLKNGIHDKDLQTVSGKICSELLLTNIIARCIQRQTTHRRRHIKTRTRQMLR